MNTQSLAKAFRRCAAVLGLLVAGGCGALLSPATPPPTIYSLAAAPGDSRTAAAQPRVPSDALPSLVINPPRAAAGFGGPQIIYVREPYRLEHFAHSEWVDTPARMLGPLIVTAIAGTGAFQAVVPAATGVVGSMRLDTEVLRLQQEFGSGPSRVRFTLRAYLLDSTTRRVVAWREFDETVVSDSDDPYGGVVAANRAVQAVMHGLADFCAEAAHNARN